MKKAFSRNKGLENQLLNVLFRKVGNMSFVNVTPINENNGDLARVLTDFSHFLVCKIEFMLH